MGSSLSLTRRASGLLLHPSSLPGPHGIGDLSASAFDFLRFLSAAGQTWWQMCPVGPTGYGSSPYQALSAFAGNPWFVSLDGLVRDGWLPKSALATKSGKPGRVNFRSMETFKRAHFRNAFERFRAARGDRSEGYERFLYQNRAWLDDFSLFCSLKHAHGGRSWVEWSPALARRRAPSLKRARAGLRDEIDYHLFVQYAFSRQWNRLRAAARAAGVGLIGDVPIFVAHDSADVWAHPELFQLNAQGRPTHVAGTPPDYFSVNGQRWGNPLFRWDRLARANYTWWIERLAGAFELFDAVRLDHFIGFHRYWKIPAKDRTAARGVWKPGPRDAFFRAVSRRLGSVPLIAEDLGAITPAIVAMRERLKLPGMRVLQFAFGGDPANVHLPHLYSRDSVVYTGTHDNDTVAGWFRDRGGPSSVRSAAVARRERKFALAYLGTGGKEIHWDFIRLAHASVANVAIIPVQDILGLGSAARMNRPGSPRGNWSWRLKPGQLTPRAAERLRSLTEIYGRALTPSLSRKGRGGTPVRGS